MRNRSAFPAFLLLIVLLLAVPVNAQTLQFLDAYFEDRIGGLFSPASVAVSPDGNHVYVGARSTVVDGFGNSVLVGAVAALRRDPASGRLEFFQAEISDVILSPDFETPSELKFSPDGGLLYGSTPKGLLLATRSPPTGTIGSPRIVTGDSGPIALDQANLYALSAGTIGAYDRVSLTLVQRFRMAASALELIAAQLAVADRVDNRLTIFGRLADGTLILQSFLENGQDGVTGLDGPVDMVASPDNKHLYVASGTSRTIAIFSRGGFTGQFSFVGATEVGGVPRRLAIAPGGRSLFVLTTNPDSLVLYDRSSTTGALTLVDAAVEGSGGVEGLQLATDVAISPMGEHVYVASRVSNAVAAFRVLDLETATFFNLSSNTTSSPEMAGGATLFVERRGGDDGNVSVEYWTADGSARGGVDYVSQRGILQWIDGDSTAKALSVPFLDDSAIEGDENFLVVLDRPTGNSALQFPSSAIVRIVDDDQSRPGACVANDTTLCLQGGRFRVTVHWRSQQGNSGVGRVEPLTDGSGVVYFFDANNKEMLVKILDGCGLTGHYWLFYAATTNQEFRLVATDTTTGQTREYFNPLFQPSEPVQDTMAFPACEQ